MQPWAKRDLCSLNAQMDFVLRDALRKSGRLRERNEPDDAKQ
jgi:hypothetical protein